MIEHPFMPRGDGSLDVKLSSEEAEAIRRVANDILDELKDTEDPGLRRLFPPAYKDDPGRNEDSGLRGAEGREQRADQTTGGLGEQNLVEYDLQGPGLGDACRVQG